RTRKRWERFRREAALHAQTEQLYTWRAVLYETTVGNERETHKTLYDLLEVLGGKLGDNDWEREIKLSNHILNVMEARAVAYRNFAADEAKQKDELLRRW